MKSHKKDYSASTVFKPIIHELKRHGERFHMRLALRPVTGFELGETVEIYDVQGRSHTSPFVGRNVTVVGIVTATATHGFYLQDPVGDGDQETSDAIYVSTISNPNVKAGDKVAVRGLVSEQAPDFPVSGSLTVTQITGSPILTVFSSENKLPRPVIIGSESRQRRRPRQDVRVPPRSLIDDDALQSYEPSSDALDFFESLEGMHVVVRSPITVSTWTRFGEIWVLADGGADALNALSPRKALKLSMYNFNPQKFKISPDPGVFDTETEDQPVGTRLRNIRGVISYSFSGYSLIPTRRMSIRRPSTLEPQVTLLSRNPLSTENRVTLATMNLLSLMHRDGHEHLHQVADTIVDNLKSPDVIALQGVLDDSGLEEDGTLSAYNTLRALVRAILLVPTCLEDDLCPSYNFIDNRFIARGANGAPAGGNIRVAYLYNTAQVRLIPGSVGTIVDSDRLTDEDSPFIDSRIPLIAKFSKRGRIFEVINVHFASKKDSAPLFGSQQPVEKRQHDDEVVSGAEKRLAQGQAIRNYMQSNPGLMRSRMVIAGEFNDFEFSEAVSAVANFPQVELTTNMTTLTNRYTTIIDGNAQATSHIIAGLALRASVDIVHTFSEFPNSPLDQDPILVTIKV